MPGVTNVDAADWEDWVTANDAVVLDIRESHEWELGTLPGSVLISMTELMERVDELPRDRPILCVCRTGSRSEKVAMYLGIIGFDNVANMTGGMKALGLQD